MIAFWSGLLELTVKDNDPDADIVWLHAAAPGGLSLAVQTVDHPLAPVTQIHLDVAVDDLDATTARIQELGGSLQKVNRLGNGFEWRIMRDPAGHEFCIFME